MFKIFFYFKVERDQYNNINTGLFKLLVKQILSRNHNPTFRILRNKFNPNISQSVLVKQNYGGNILIMENVPVFNN